MPGRYPRDPVLPHLLGARAALASQRSTQSAAWLLLFPFRSELVLSLSLSLFVLLNTKIKIACNAKKRLLPTLRLVHYLASEANCEHFAPAVNLAMIRCFGT